MLEMKNIGGPWDTVAILEDEKQIGTIRKISARWQVTMRNGMVWNSELLKVKTNSANFRSLGAAKIFVERIMGET